MSFARVLVRRPSMRSTPSIAQQQCMARSLSTQSTAALRPSASQRASPWPQQPILSPSIILLEQRHSSFLHDNSGPSSRSQPQNIARKGFFACRREQKQTHKKISTLALEHNALLFEDAGRTEKGPQSSEKSKSQGSTQAVSRRQRRLMLLGIVLLMPIIGRDLIEVVVPGMLGVIIFVAGKIKAGVKLVRSFGGGRER